MNRVSREAVVSALRELADRDFQERVWLGRDPRGLVSSFLECAARLFDDSNLGPELDAGRSVFDVQIDHRLTDIRRLLGQVDGAQGEAEIFDDPRLLRAVRLAAGLLRDLHEDGEMVSADQVAHGPVAVSPHTCGQPRRPRVGEVYLVPAGDGVSALQVLARRPGFVLGGIHATVHRRDSVPYPDAAATDQPALMAWMPEAAFTARLWQRIGSAPIDPAISLPAYRARPGASSAAEDHTGLRRTGVAARIAARLPAWEAVDPSRVELAATALATGSALPADASAMRPPVEDLTTRAIFDRGTAAAPPGCRLRSRLARAGNVEAAVNPLDWPIMRVLIDAGENLSRALPTLHTLRFASRDAADRATRAVRSLGWHPRLAPGCGDWHITIPITMVVTGDSVAAVRRELEHVAAVNGGDYPGWEVDVASVGNRES